MYTGWLVSDESINKLKKIFNTIHPDFIGHHVTYKFGSDELPPESELKIIGECATDKIQCFVVEVNGTIIRPDNQIYHLTWSINRKLGAKPVDSNLAIKLNGFSVISDPILIHAIPKKF